MWILELTPSIYLRPITESQNKIPKPKATQSKPKPPKRTNGIAPCLKSLTVYHQETQQAKKTGVQNALNNKEAFCLAPPATDFHPASRLLSRLFPFLQ